MKEPTSVLIDPFRAIYEALTMQARAWGNIHHLIGQSIQLPQRLLAVRDQLGTAEGLEALDELIKQGGEVARAAQALGTSQRPAILYAGLVGSWAIVEAAFDDLMVRILESDPDSKLKLTAAGIKLRPNLDDTRDALYVPLERWAKARSRGFVVEFHRACLHVFEINLEYATGYTDLIEQLNQVRNCILHRQGVIDDKAAHVAPRLKQFVGKQIPADDPLFRVAPTMLGDYTFAWIKAFAQSPYLRGAMRPVVKTPPTDS